MKRFYYKISKETISRMYGGANVTADVYKHTRNGMKHIGSLEWCTRSYKGEESEVFTFLIDKKELPKKAYNWSESKSSSGGYYNWTFKEDHNVSIERL